MVRFVFPVLVSFLIAFQAAAQDDLLSPAPQRVDVVALMVEFQPDTTRFSTGDGTFGGELFPGAEPPSIDPLPHDAPYFDAHLRFLENYIRNVSDGRTTVTTHLLPDVVRVSGTMGTYSPTGPDADSDQERAKLASLVKEAWETAQAEGLTLPGGLDPETTAFVIFHAGVGRDIELVGTTLDKTPEDLPSIFFGPKALQTLGAGDVTFDGMPVASTMILPRTESRMGINPLTSEPFLIELSINGLLAASFLNWLGVPDLFNTADGSSAVGPFDVMDALGIFAYNGLLPPEPSAWTKYYLGWADLVEVTPDSPAVSLTAAGDRQANDVARVRISDAEYFLVENRHRDPEGDGVNLRIWTRNGEQEISFPNGDPEFNDGTVAGFPGGVILEADNYDFSLPGGVDENDNPLLGGMLIWHIDENRLQAGLADNAVNADREARAIDLEEADGAQDIGYGSGGGFFSAQFDLGTPFDFWYEGNPVTVRTSAGQDIRLYENRFAPDTTPPNLTNAGQSPGFQLLDFSPPGPSMSFRVASIPVSGPSLLAEWELGAWNEAPGETGLMWPSQDPAGFLIWRKTEDGLGRSVWQPAEGARCGRETLGVRPAFDGSVLYEAAPDGIWRVTPLVSGCQRDRVTSTGGGILSVTSDALEWVRLPGVTKLFAGVLSGGNPALMVVSIHDDGRVDTQQLASTSTIERILVVDRTREDLLLLTEIGVLDPEGNLVVSLPDQDWSSAVAAGSADAWNLAWAAQDGTVRVLSSDEGGLDVRGPGGCAASRPAWYPVDQDGVADLVFSCGRKVVATHRSGAILDGFPISLSADIESDFLAARTPTGQTMLFAGTEVGLEAVLVDDAATSVADGYPLAVGRQGGTMPLLMDNAIVTLSGSGSLRAWAFSSIDALNASDRGVLLASANETAPSAGSGLIDGRETYNWPNPIEEGSTRIRFSVREMSDITIDIVDMSGVRMERIELASVQAGIPREVVWETEAGSGIYLARVRARSVTGSAEDTRLIRMAIIR